MQDRYMEACRKIVKGKMNNDYGRFTAEYLNVSETRNVTGIKERCNVRNETI